MADARLLLICGAFVLACLAVVLLLRPRRRAGPMVEQPRPLPSLKGSLDADARGRRVDIAFAHEVLEMLEAGRRDEVVALVRERTGWGAEEASRVVAWAENLKKRLES